MRTIVFLFIVVFSNGCVENVNSKFAKHSSGAENLSADSILEMQFEAMGGRSKLENLKYIHQIQVNVVDKQTYHFETWIHLGHRAITKMQVEDTEVFYYSLPGIGIYAEHNLSNPQSYYIADHKVENKPSARMLHGDSFYGNFDLLLHYKENGINVERLDSAEINPPVYKLLISYPDSSKLVVVIDTATHLAITTTTFTPKGRAEKDARFSDFERTPEGFIIPKRQVYSSIDGNGEYGARFYAKVLKYDYSTTVPKEIFQIDRKLVKQYNETYPLNKFPVDLFENDK